LEGVSAASEYVAPKTETEKLLVGIWAEILKLSPEEVSATANFFELGGDSILSIQVVSRAARLGLYFTIKDLFHAQCIQVLSGLAKDKKGFQASQEAVKGDLSLLPIQKEFFEDETALEHYNQSVLLVTPKGFNRECLSGLIQKLFERHDALRLRFKRSESGWTGEHVAFDNALLEDALEYKHLDKFLPDVIESYATTLQKSLNLQSGRLFKAAYISDDNERGRLLLVIHHLVVDGVSWRILLEDIELLYTQLQTERPLKLAAKSTSYKDWGAFLLDYAGSESLDKERDYWLSLYQTSIAQLRDADIEKQNSMTRQEFDVASFNLDKSLTSQLLTQCNQVYRTHINELLLSGLLLGIYYWNGEQKIRIDLEGHGREILTDDLDLSQTVGWFTTVYPLALVFEGGFTFEKLICSVKEQYRAIPNNGIGFGVFKYLSGDKAFKALPDNELVFNYLGQFDQVLNKDKYFNRAMESTGENISRMRRPSHPLEMNGQVIAEQLSFNLSFDSSIYPSGEMQGLMDAISQALESIVKHCLTIEKGCYTPSDFPLAKVEVSELNEWQKDVVIEDLYPATGMQQGLLFHSLLESSSYATQTVMDFSDLDISSFQRAWQQVIQRHGIFRTAFVGLETGNAHQLVYEKVELPWEEEDLSGVDKANQVAQFESIRLSEKSKGFDMSCAPLMRMKLLKLSEDIHQLIWTFHHSLLDGWCTPIVFSEVTECYRAIRANNKPKLGELHSYRNYAAWLSEQDKEEARNFWREQLERVVSTTPLPLVGRGSSTVGTMVHEYGVLFSDEETVKLMELAHTSRTTMNVIVQSGWALLLSRYSGERSVTFGATTSGRPPDLHGVEQMVGLFINSVPVVVDVHEQLNVAEWLQLLHTQQVEREAHTYLPLFEIQQLAPIAHGLFDSLLVFENYPVDEAIGEQTKTADLQVHDVNHYEGTNYGISLQAHLSQQLSIKFEVKAHLMSLSNVEQLGKHLKQLLMKMVDSKKLPVSKIEMLSEAETRHLIYELNDTQVDYPNDKLIHEVFELQVEKTPDSIAVEFEGESLSYKGLNEESNRLAQYLREQGVGAETLVAICAERSLEMVVGIIATLKAGGAYVPFDPSYPTARLEYMLHDTGVKHVLTLSELMGVFKGLSEISIIELNSECHKNEMKNYSANNPIRGKAQHTSNLAYVIYTSGSTGQPKGVMVEHKALLNRIYWMQQNYCMSTSDRVLQKTPYNFDVSVWEFLWTLGFGGSLIVAKPEGHKDVQYLERIIEDKQITLLHFVPSMLNAYISVANAQFSSSVRRIFCSGEVLDLKDVQALNKRAPYVALSNLYGPTEAAIDVSFFDCTEELLCMPIGKPIGNIQLYVLDRSLNCSPIGSIGELFIGGVGLARGYLNQIELTKEKFISNPFNDEAGSKLYRTGDLVRYMLDGNLEFVGRMDAQIKIRGFRVELGEIEHEISKAEMVSGAVALAREDEEGDKRIVAYVVLRHESNLNGSAGIEELRQQLQRRLPDYMIPSTFVVLDEIPLTPNGKVNRNALPKPTNDLLVDEYIAPRTETEKVLVEVWAKLLKLKPEEISTDASFFELGGHSLSVIRMVVEIQMKLSVNVEFAQLFQQKNIQSTAEMIDEIITLEYLEKNQGEVEIKSEGVL
jgi:amino acid adenylation domain-containing protein/non-ribosomal peptide synthase protein (TIGR01720 family)